ncbi:precorrin-6A synthase (deacetylating) [Phaeovibrio sulfidiphilus]|uniref:Precorrin-6A synthase [deacetylating] n=1 Tax=Phaeovibrio sulfidiphilus TaxID=1220600 RepID=A0A8J6YNE8_9PROT|nr:precorrin-6A synthase (deacetylating) [Phaeovibrio sulfidiphilus]MBE1236536.1 precorrin-6A synthase (deacetylating) [Phaeovibrio sulfidiphilus]
MKTIHLIGIGAGNPEHLTLEAVRVLNTVDVFFLLEKDGVGKDALLDVRRSILEKHATAKPWRVVTSSTPARDREAANYEAAVKDWRDKRSEGIHAMIANEMADGEIGAFLVWGDPNLYDGMIDSLLQIQAEDPNLGMDFTVIPGITCIQALTAAHRIPLNRIGESITITTGRLLEDMDPAEVTNAVVMLDAKRTYRGFAETGHTIYWGAYLGTSNQILARGPVGDVSAQIDQALDNGRQRNGWIMDTYILRSNAEPGDKKGH